MAAVREVRGWFKSFGFQRYILIQWSHLTVLVSNCNLLQLTLLMCCCVIRSDLAQWLYWSNWSNNSRLTLYCGDPSVWWAEFCCRTLMHFSIALQTPDALFGVVRANISQTNPSKTRLNFLVGRIYQPLIDSSYLDAVTLVLLHPCLLCASPALNIYLCFLQLPQLSFSPFSFLCIVKTTCFFSARSS